MSGVAKGSYPLFVFVFRIEQQAQAVRLVFDKIKRFAIITI